MVKILSSVDGDSRAISPVIGVILLVAITVILAAGVGAFAFGFDDTQESAPSAAVESSASGQTVEFSISGGDSFDPDDVEVKIDVTVADTASGTEKETTLETGLSSSNSKSVTVGSESVDVKYTSNINGDEASAGDSFEVSLKGTSNDDIEIVGYNTTVVHENEDQSSSAVLYSDTYSESYEASNSNNDDNNNDGDQSPGFEISPDIGDSSQPYTLTFEVGSGEIDGEKTDIRLDVTVEDTETGDTQTHEVQIMDEYSDMNKRITSNIVLCEVADGEYCASLQYQPEPGDGFVYQQGDTFGVEIANAGPDKAIVGYDLDLKQNGEVIYEDSQ